jgi:hypothetical protein
VKDASLLPHDLRLGILPPRSQLSLVSPRVSVSQYESRMSQIQRFRGSIYLGEGAIPPDALDMTGRHYEPFDCDNWHLFITDAKDEVCGCIRVVLKDVPARVEQLKVFEFVERMPPERRPPYRAALQAFLKTAEDERVQLGESGGWAVSPRIRSFGTAVVLIHANWAFCRLKGHGLVLSAATMRHGSAHILRRLGGFPLIHAGQPISRFYDSFHRCEMEIIAFDSRRAPQEYEPRIEQIRTTLGGAFSNGPIHSGYPGR